MFSEMFNGLGEIGYLVTGGISVLAAWISLQIKKGCYNLKHSLVEMEQRNKQFDEFIAKSKDIDEILKAYHASKQK